MYEVGKSCIVVGGTFFGSGVENAADEHFKDKHFYRVRFTDISRCLFDGCTFVMCSFNSFTKIDNTAFCGCTFIKCTFESPHFSRNGWENNKFSECYFEKVNCAIDGTLVGKNFLCASMSRDREDRDIIRAKVMGELHAIYGAVDFTVFYLDNDCVFVGEYGKTFVEKLLTADNDELIALGKLVNNVVCKTGLFCIGSGGIKSPEKRAAILDWAASIRFGNVKYQLFDFSQLEFTSITEDDIRNMKYFPASIQYFRAEDHITVNFFVIQSQEYKMRKKKS